jgi:DNA polymerase
MNMTREDILHELELLPVWKLRVPPVVQAVVVSAPDVVVKAEPQVDSVLSPEPVIADAVVPIPVVQKPEVEKPEAEKIVKQWAFVCGASSTQVDECALLMSNIIKATHLELADYVLLNEIQALAIYQVGDILLFGLDMANKYLNASEIDLGSLRGQYHMVEDVRCWVTYHPEQMLQDPLLKREVWRDICAAMPKLAK